MPIDVSGRQLNRATLERQLLLRREPLAVAEAVRRVLALQAQEPASPYIALWNRVARFDPADLDAAFAGFELVKASLMRITLHAVHADDYPILHEAMQRTLRAARLGDDRFRAAGLTVEQADALIPELLAFAAAGQARSNAEMDAWLAQRLGVATRPGAWWALRTYAPFVHEPIGGAWSFGQRPAYIAAPRQDRPGDTDASLDRLVMRYLEGFGPASVRDIGQFALIQRSFVKASLERLGDTLVRLDGPDAQRLYDVPGRSLPDESTPAPPRLLPMWDSILLAYFDRSRVIPESFRRAVIRPNGDVLPTVLVDGYVAGVWRPMPIGGKMAIEATAFHALAVETWAGLDEEAASLIALLEARDRGSYSRYGRWWAQLPRGEEVRLLGLARR
jgi:hypothetical protein